MTLCPKVHSFLLRCLEAVCAHLGEIQEIYIYMTDLRALFHHNALDRDASFVLSLPTLNNGQILPYRQVTS